MTMRCQCVATTSDSVQGSLGSDGADRGGWAAYGVDWQHFFDCMFAPVAKPTLQALNKLNIVPAPRSAGPSLLAALASFLTGEPSKVPSQGTATRVRAILPRHGPLVLQSVTQLVNEYARRVSEHVVAQAVLQRAFVCHNVACGIE